MTAAPGELQEEEISSEGAAGGKMAPCRGRAAGSFPHSPAHNRSFPPSTPGPTSGPFPNTPDP